MMPTLTYDQRRGQLEDYFDRTAMEAWKRLTSDAPVSGIRATVRAGRDRMRSTLLGWLPEDLRGARILDAGCGTGALATEVAKRGGHVVAVDVAANLVNLARERLPEDLGGGSIDFRVGDMMDPAHGEFDYVVCMDSLIHYQAQDVVQVVSRFTERAQGAVLFTFAPRTPALAVMHTVGRIFPKGNRAPSIQPVAEDKLRRKLSIAPELEAWRPARTERVASGFYTSQAMEMRRA